MSIEADSAFQAAVQRALADGWRLDDAWKEEVATRCDAMDDGDALCSIVAKSPCLPDAWRFSDARTLEFLDFDLGNPPDQNRLIRYEILWLAFSASRHMRFRVWRMTPGGVTTALLTEETTHPAVGRRRDVLGEGNS